MRLELGVRIRHLPKRLRGSVANRSRLQWMLDDEPLYRATPLRLDALLSLERSARASVRPDPAASPICTRHAMAFARAWAIVKLGALFPATGHLLTAPSSEFSLEIHSGAEFPVDLLARLQVLTAVPAISVA
jgi:hypothetical protein